MDLLSFIPLFEIQENDACGRDSALKFFKVKVSVQYQGSSVPYEELVELGKKVGNMSKNGTVRKSCRSPH